MIQKYNKKGKPNNFFKIRIEYSNFAWEIEDKFELKVAIGLRSKILEDNKTMDFEYETEDESIIIKKGKIDAVIINKIYWIEVISVQKIKWYTD